MSERFKKGDPVPVIVRSADERPAHLLAVGRAGAYVDITQDVTGVPLAFPGDRVFQYDKTIFAALSGAFDAGDWQTLSELWDRCSVFREIL